VSREERLAILAALLVAGIALVVWQSGTASQAPETLGAVEGVTWKAAYPPGHEHLALPWDIGSVIWGPHPLYCGTNHPGQYRDALIDRGWADWIADPPSEATI
jgi:hypothetical protein